MKLKSLLYSLLIASMTSTVYAQVKIGNNPGTIGATSNLEVESSNGTKVVVDKTTGYLGAGVTDPSQSIDGAGTARLRNIPTNTTNNLILTVDANGVIAKQNASAAQLPTVVGNLATNGVDIAANESNSIYTGASITLPANSKYIINITMLLSPTAALPTGTSSWVRSTLADSPSANLPSPDITGTPLVSGLIPANSSYSLMTGSIIIKNTSNAPKTYYYKAGSTSPVGNVSGILLQKIGAGYPPVSENAIYAIPVN